jgi:hypothetical protein
VVGSWCTGRGAAADATAHAGAPGHDYDGDKQLLAINGPLATLRRCIILSPPMALPTLPAGMMNAVSGDKAPDKSQGELTGLLKAMGYTAEQVCKF